VHRALGIGHRALCIMHRELGIGHWALGIRLLLLWLSAVVNCYFVHVLAQMY
jgi:hypothetical protein